ncbi:MAG: acyltransferase [Clostridia bacterium]|nr:acyltransferase [Clostridia bacterium]
MIENRYRPDILNVLRVMAALFVFFLHGRTCVPGISETASPLAFLTCTPAWAGVWIFLFISAYLMGIGFAKGKYKLTGKSGKLSIKAVLVFYLKRYIRFAPIYYIYCFVFELFRGTPFFYKNPEVFWKMITFRFNGDGGVSGLGHLWYLSLAMQIYMIIPIVYLLLSLVKKESVLKVLFFVFLGMGLFYRIMMYNKNVSWYYEVYTYIWANMDIVFCGITLAIISCMTNKKGIPRESNILWGVFANLQFIALVIYNCYIYHSGMKTDNFIYRYLLPTLYILSCAMLIIKYHNPHGIEKKTPGRFNILKFFDWFAPYTFGFYILHMIVFSYFGKTIGKATTFLELPLRGRYVVFFGCCFVITLLGAWILTCAEKGVTKHIEKMLHLK